MLQHLLESQDLTLSHACETARALEYAQYDSEYSARVDTQVSAAVTTSGENVPQSNDYTAPLQTTRAFVNATAVKKQRWFCGVNFHNRSKCPALNSECITCGKTGHWAKACRSRRNQRVTAVVNSNELSKY